eukprot:3760716-Prymnesium_polylepis.1
MCRARCAVPVGGVPLPPSRVPARPRPRGTAGGTFFLTTVYYQHVCGRHSCAMFGHKRDA